MEPLLGPPPPTADAARFSAEIASDRPHRHVDEHPGRPVLPPQPFLIRSHLTRPEPEEVGRRERLARPVVGLVDGGVDLEAVEEGPTINPGRHYHLHPLAAPLLQHQPEVDQPGPASPAPPRHGPTTSPAAALAEAAAAAAQTPEPDPFHLDPPLPPRDLLGWG